MADEWPSVLWLLRHGQSAGNVARDAAEAGGLPRIDIAQRDMDVPLSDLGQQQAVAIGRWFREQPAAEQPTAILTSPYVRASETARLVRDETGLPEDEAAVLVDERLREREFGILDRLTRAGITELFPEQAEMRAFLGKFYHRPPGGESWCDVGLRLRSVIDSVRLTYGGERLLVVTHEVVIKMFRYVLECLDEQAVLEIDRGPELANCSLTAYARGPRQGHRPPLRLVAYNDVSAVRAVGAPVTRAEDAPVARG
jgi:2,3-bisphosphoglycerate-dependent phosphoglycerate mutase